MLTIIYFLTFKVFSLAADKPRTISSNFRLFFSFSTIGSSGVRFLRFNNLSNMLSSLLLAGTGVGGFPLAERSSDRSCTLELQDDKSIGWLFPLLGLGLGKLVVGAVEL